jgi:hypothetical protein
MAPLIALAGIDRRGHSTGTAFEVPAVVRALQHGLQEFDWAQAAGSVVVVGVAALSGRLFAAVIVRLLARWGRRSGSGVEAALGLHVDPALRWLGPALGVHVALDLASLPAEMLETVRHTLLVILIALGGWLAAGFVHVLEAAIGQRFDLSVTDNLRARVVRTQMRGLANVHWRGSRSQSPSPYVSRTS